MKKRLQALRNEEGLTLVELLAVIVILAIIAVVAFVMIGQVIENSKMDTHISNAQQMIASTKLFEAQGEDYTTTGAASSTVTLTDLQTGGHIDKIYDSWDKGEITTGTVTITHTAGAANTYSVELDSDPAGKCDVNATEDELVADDRDDLCDI